MNTKDALNALIDKKLMKLYFLAYLVHNFYNRIMFLNLKNKNYLSRYNQTFSAQRSRWHHINLIS